MNISEVIDINRKTLESVESFITDEDYHNSPDNYGLPPQVRHLIDLPIDREITYVDLIMYLQTFFEAKEINYVEIGDSVLKTFYQVANFLNHSNLYAFDINKINPTIESKFTKVESSDQLNQYEYNTNKISHFRGDVYNYDDFDKFKTHINSKVNILFSDACHSREGLESEYEYFIKDALADEFILYYDDLDHDEMREVFFDVGHELGLNNSNVTIALLRVNGWLGNHEFAHLNGIITTLDLKTIMDDSIPIEYK